MVWHIVMAVWIDWVSRGTGISWIARWGWYVPAWRQRRISNGVVLYPPIPAVVARVVPHYVDEIGDDKISSKHLRRKLKVG